jgi:hypothetical protein
LVVRHGWPFKFNDSNLTVEHFTTGSKCLVFGSDHIIDVEKALGMGRVVLLIIDEAGAWRQNDLQYAIEEIVGPALMDIEGSQVMVGGTPGTILVGYWYDLTTRQTREDGSLRVPGYSIYEWDLDENPHMPKGTKQKVKRIFGWTDDTPAYIRQYLGKWCIDPSSLVFSAFDETNLIFRPEAPLRSGCKVDRVLSIDFGVVHATAFLILETRGDVPGIFVPYSEAASGMAPTEVADRAKELSERWGCRRIIGDLGGMGKAYAEEMVRRHGVNIIPADKRDKIAMVEMTNDGFRGGVLRLDPRHNAVLVDQLRRTQWDELHSSIADGQQDDLIDALCYGYQHVRATYVEPPPVYDPYKEPPERKKRSNFYNVDIR